MTKEIKFWHTQDLPKQDSNDALNSPKNWQTGSHEIKNICIAKEYISLAYLKCTYKMGSCPAIYTQSKLIYRTHKELQKVNIMETIYYHSIYELSFLEKQQKRPEKAFWMSLATKTKI